MDERSFFSVLESKVGRYEPQVLRLAVEKTGQALGAMLAANGLRALVDRVCEPVAEHVRDGFDRDPISLDDVYASISKATGLRLGVALELAQSVLQQLSENLDAKTRADARARLPDPWCVFFTERERYHGHPPLAELEVGKGHTLATGHPGSDQPVSEAHSEAQRGSMAASDDPHAESKLASSEGLSSDRRGETLAKGKPKGSSRPLSGAND